MTENVALLRESRFAHKGREGTNADEEIGLDRSRESLLKFGGNGRQACILGIVRESKPAATIYL